MAHSRQREHDQEYYYSPRWASRASGDSLSYASQPEYVHYVHPRPMSGLGRYSWAESSSGTSQELYFQGHRKYFRRSFCGVCLSVSIVAIIIAVIGVVAIAAYLGVMTADDSEALKYEMGYTGKFRVTRGDFFYPTLADGTTDDFRDKADRYKTMLETVYSSSYLSEAFRRAAVEGFGNDSLTVFFRIHLDRRKVPTSVLNTEEAVRDVITQEVMSLAPRAFRSISIDIDSIEITREAKDGAKKAQYVSKSGTNTIQGIPDYVENAKGTLNNEKTQVPAQEHKKGSQSLTTSTSPAPRPEVEPTMSSQDVSPSMEKSDEIGQVYGGVSEGQPLGVDDATREADDEHTSDGEGGTDVKETSDLAEIPKPDEKHMEHSEAATVPDPDSFATEMPTTQTLDAIETTTVAPGSLREEVTTAPQVEALAESDYVGDVDDDYPKLTEVDYPAEDYAGEVDKDYGELATELAPLLAAGVPPQAVDRIGYVDESAEVNSAQFGKPYGQPQFAEVQVNTAYLSRLTPPPPLSDSSGLKNHGIGAVDDVPGAQYKEPPQQGLSGGAPSGPVYDFSPWQPILPAFIQSQNQVPPSLPQVELPATTGAPRYPQPTATTSRQPVSFSTNKQPDPTPQEGIQQPTKLAESRPPSPTTLEVLRTTLGVTDAPESREGGGEVPQQAPSSPSTVKPSQTSPAATSPDIDKTKAALTTPAEADRPEKIAIPNSVSVRKGLIILSPDDPAEEQLVTHPSGIINKRPTAATPRTDRDTTSVSTPPTNRVVYSTQVTISEVQERSTAQTPEPQQRIINDGFQTIVPGSAQGVNRMGIAVGRFPPTRRPVISPPPSTATTRRVLVVEGVPERATSAVRDPASEQSVVVNSEVEKLVTRPILQPVTSYSGVHRPIRPKPPSAQTDQLPDSEVAEPGGEFYDEGPLPEGAGTSPEGSLQGVTNPDTLTTPGAQGNIATPPSREQVMALLRLMALRYPSLMASMDRNRMRILLSDEEERRKFLAPFLTQDTSRTPSAETQRNNTKFLEIAKISINDTGTASSDRRSRGLKFTPKQFSQIPSRYRYPPSISRPVINSSLNRSMISVLASITRINVAGEGERRPTPAPLAASLADRLQLTGFPTRAPPRGTGATQSQASLRQKLSDKLMRFRAEEERRENSMTESKEEEQQKVTLGGSLSAIDRTTTTTTTENSVEPEGHNAHSQPALRFDDFRYKTTQLPNTSSKVHIISYNEGDSVIDILDKIFERFHDNKPPAGNSLTESPQGDVTQATRGQTENEVGVTKASGKRFRSAPTPEPEPTNFTVHGCDPLSELQCPVSGECVPAISRCDRKVDCRDGSDERHCTCADHLRSQSTQHQRKICDGVVDCHDLSDEQFCDWCGPDKFICPEVKRCIDRSAICDGRPDCPGGADESQCVTVSSARGAADRHHYQPVGFLMVRKKGVWGPLCVDDFESLVERSGTTWGANDLGRAVCRALTYSDAESVYRVESGQPPRVSSEGPFYRLLLGGATSPLESAPSRTSLQFTQASCPRQSQLHVTCSQLQCGVRPRVNQRQARIVGGGNTSPGAWPWQAAMYRDGEFQCGATLISDRWLVSAGHCYHRSIHRHWVARLGAYRRGSSLLSPYESLNVVSHIIMHRDYQDVGFVNDIALLRLEEPVKMSDYIRPVCLPPPERSVPNGALCTVVGWGQLFESGRFFPDALQEVQLPVISAQECKKRTVFLPLYRITEDMFCAGYERGGRDACLGDSGGPLMCQEASGEWTLTGVTSNGYGCARAGRPGVYTKVAHYVQWITETMSRPLPPKLRSHCDGHRCPLGRCLSTEDVCDGVIQCSDGSDEQNCQRTL